METARKFLSEFDISTLDLDDKLLEAYQLAPPGNRSFHCRLIELVTVAVHQIAVLLFRRRYRIHDKETNDPTYTIDAVTSWTSPSYGGFVTRIPDPTLFMHLCYGALGQYPDELAGVVGYWTENRILGGVIIFNRSDAWDDECRPEPNVYIHADRARVDFQLWQMLDEQQQSLIDFILSSPAETLSAGIKACPFPLLPSDRNLKRVHPDNPTKNKVYRDIWERAQPTGAFNGCR